MCRIARVETTKLRLSYSDRIPNRDHYRTATSGSGPPRNPKTLITPIKLTLFPKTAEYFFGGCRERFRYASTGLIRSLPPGRIGRRSIVPLACGLAGEPGIVGGRSHR